MTIVARTQEEIDIENLWRDAEGLDPINPDTDQAIPTNERQSR